MHLLVSFDFFPKIGGAHLWLYEVYKRWPKPVTLITQDYKHDLTLFPKQIQFDSADHDSLKILRKDFNINDINLLNRIYLKRLFRTIRLINTIAGERPLILHCLRAFPEGIVALGLKLLQGTKCEFITYAHGEELLVAQTSRQLQLLSRLVYKKSSLVIANSKSTKDLVRSATHDARITVIHPGVDTTAFDVSNKERVVCREKCGWPPDTIIFITIARMELRKNQASVIKAIADLRKEGLPLAYLLGGTGEEENNLRNLAYELGLSSWVKFLGRVPEKEKPLYYASADIHIMPSIQVGAMIEGFGIVFLEAAAAGLPSIAGKIGGQAEAVLDGRTGLVVDGSSITELKDAIRCLATQKELRRKMGEQALLWAGDHDWLKVTKKTIFQVERACGL